MELIKQVIHLIGICVLTLAVCRIADVVVGLLIGFNSKFDDEE